MWVGFTYEYITKKNSFFPPPFQFKIKKFFFVLFFYLILGGKIANN